MDSSNLPNPERAITLSKEDFLAVLDDLRAWIAMDDSMEGSLAYEWASEPDTYRVQGFVRFGNSDGQGGARVLQSIDA